MIVDVEFDSNNKMFKATVKYLEFTISSFGRMPKRAVAFALQELATVLLNSVKPFPRTSHNE